MLLEICVENLESAIIAERAGADRIELCSSLHLAGLTPSFSLLKELKEKISIPIHVMIRPRAGDFVYSDDEFDEMKNQIQMVKQWNTDGVVFGVLDKENNIDVKRTTELVEISRPMKVTFHRAFDETKNPSGALEDIIACYCDILLTSGQNEIAINGTELISVLNKKAAGRIEIMAGSGINEKNILEIAAKTGIQSFHASAKKSVHKDNQIFADQEMIIKMKAQLCKLVK